MERHEQWLHKATADLYVAQRELIQNDERAFESVIYFTQQAAEKALKAFLVFHEQPIIKTHDLEKLLRACCYIDKELDQFFESARFLTPLASEYRYPADDFDDLQVPTLNDLALAVAAASTIVDAIQKKIG